MMLTQMINSTAFDCLEISSIEIICVWFLSRLGRLFLMVWFLSRLGRLFLMKHFEDVMKKQICLAVIMSCESYL
jgi:hypothetical protein